MVEDMVGQLELLKVVQLKLVVDHMVG